MRSGLVVTFWGVTVLLIVVPGPDWAFTLASGLRDRVVYPAVGGLMIGYAILTVVVAAGVGALVAQNPVVLTVLTVVGAGYLIYLGGTLLARPATLHGPTTADDPTASPWQRRVLAGIGVSGLNPKGLLIFLALLPQFTDPNGIWPVPAQLAVLGLVFVLSCGVFYSALGLSTRAILRTRPTVSHAVSRLSGAAMLIIGLFLLVERLAPMVHTWLEG
jgi:threonine/homoserine/homoserine lactone efflux protein